MLDVGYGYVNDADGAAYFRYADPADTDVYTYDTFTDLCDSLRKRYGCIEVSVQESYHVHKFAFTIHEKPF